MICICISQHLKQRYHEDLTKVRHHAEQQVRQVTLQIRKQSGTIETQRQQIEEEKRKNTMLQRRVNDMKQQVQSMYENKMKMMKEAHRRELSQVTRTLRSDMDELKRQNAQYREVVLQLYQYVKQQSHKNQMRASHSPRTVTREYSLRRLNHQSVLL